MSRHVRPTYANLAATLALVVALGSGGAYAAGLAKNSVGSKQIKNAAIKAKDVGTGALTGDQVQDGALSSSDVQDNSLTGADVNESTLNLPATPAVFEGPISTDNVDLTGNFATYASLTYTAPANGFVVLDAAATFNAKGTSGVVYCLLEHDTTEAAAVFWDAGDVDGAPTTPLTDQRQSARAVVPVTAGTHTVTLLLKEAQPSNPTPTYSSAYGTQIIAEFFPAGSAQP